MGKLECQQLLDKLCKELNIPSPPPFSSDNKTTLLELNNSLKIECKILEPIGMILRAPIGSFPEQKRDEILHLVMRANFLAQGTGGAAIGIDSTEKNLSLSLKLPYELTTHTFKEQLENFANYLTYWRANISS